MTHKTQHCAHLEAIKHIHWFIYTRWWKTPEGISRWPSRRSPTQPDSDTSGLRPPFWKMAELDVRSLRQLYTVEKKRDRREKQQGKTTSGLRPPSWILAKIPGSGLGQSPTIEKQQVGRENRLQKLFPVWCRHLGKWLKSIEPSSNNRNPSRSHEGNPGNCSENALPVCCHHGRKWSKSAGTGGIHQEPTSVNHPYTIPLTSPRSARLVKIPIRHRQHSTTVSRAELCAMNNPPLNLTHFRSTDVIHFRSAGFSDGCFLSDLTSSWRELQFQGWSWGGASVPRMLKPVSTRK